MVPSPPLHRLPLKGPPLPPDASAEGCSFPPTATIARVYHLWGLITDANFDYSTTGFSLQAMDSSHVALVALLLRSEGFEHYCCDRNLSMGMNLNNMAKMLRCAGNDDIITVKADDGGDTVTFMFESANEQIWDA